jgi:hypothetical protein
MQYDFHIGDELQLKKAHPCGSDRWTVYRLGADIGLRCLGCGRYVMLPRTELARRLKRVLAAGAPTQPTTGDQT